MPPINHYQCNQCKSSLPSGWGGYLFVENDEGERVVCKHPGERFTINEVLGTNLIVRILKGRTRKKRLGYASNCLCLDCFHVFYADLADEDSNRSMRGFYKRTSNMVGGKDKRECSKCQSGNVKTTCELVGEPCPKCHVGIIEEIETGIVS